MKKILIKCPAISDGGPSQEVCTWYADEHCKEYNTGKNRNKCQVYKTKSRIKK